MSRTRYIDYRANDATVLLNNQFRGVFEAGVYLGFNVTTGSGGGFWLAFNHDTDPDNTGEVLGVIITRDGVTIAENEDQDDVVAGVAPGGSDEIHWVVASYTYNQALPNNDVSYIVKTAVAPATPTLTDDEILLAEIDVPTGSASYSASGVDIKTVGKKSIYDINLFNLFAKFDKILNPGIYDGMIASEGTTQLQVSLSSGVWITQENARIVEAAQSDVFTLTNPGSNSYKYAWIVGMHKNEDLDPQPSVDYLLVQGTAAALGSQASLPSNSDILTDAVAVDAKYDDASYINKLGYIRIENQSGTYVISYYLGETVLNQDTITVYGAEANSLSRSGKYYGDEGLRQAIEDIYAISKDRSDIGNQKYTILLDGVFKMDDTYLTLPSNILLKGLGAPAKIESDEGSEGVVRAVGFNAVYNAADDTVSQSTWVGGSPPSGYVARNFEIQSTYRVGEDLVERKFSVGDPIVVVDDGTTNVYIGTIQGYDTSSNNWTVRVYISDQYNTDGNPEQLDLTFSKRNLGLDSVDIDRKTSAGTGALVINYVEDSIFSSVKTRNLDLLEVSLTNFGLIEVENNISQWDDCFSNRYDYLKIRCPQATLNIGGGTETKSSFGVIDVDTGDTVSTFTLELYSRCTVEKIIMDGGTASELVVDATSSVVGHISNLATGPVTIEGTLGYITLCTAAGNVDFDAASVSNVIANLNLAGTLSYSTSQGNKVLNMTGTTRQDFLEHANADRNLAIVSDATITWNATTGVLSWDDVIRFDNPWDTGYSEIAAGSAILGTDGDRLVVDIDRDSTGVSSVSESVVTKASTSDNALEPDRVFVAIRFGDTVYMYDGTRIEDTQSIQLGATPPPDGSVTYEKLGGSALDFHNKFFRDYVTLDTDTDWPSEVAVLNTDLRTMTYTVSTGVIQYSGSIDLSSVKPGDMVILSNCRVASTNCWNREEIYAVDDGANEITISSGLNSLVTGAATIWNGAIVRGDMAVSNYSLSTVAYARDTGRVTFVPGLGFSQNQVENGYIFYDTDGKKHLIRGYDTSGSGDWIEIGKHKRDVGVGVPSDSSYGSIRVNNNPHNIKTADLRVSTGMEFIPIDWYGQKAQVDNEDITFIADTDSAINWFYPEPIDNRVRVALDCQARSGDNRQLPGYSFDVVPETSIQAMSQNFIYVSVTAVCTGASLVIEHSGKLYPLVLDVYVDGDLSSSFALFTGSDECDIAYSPQRHFHANVVKHFSLLRLPLGVHSIQWKIPTTFISGVNPVSVRGVILYTAPGGDDTKLIHSPGTLVRKGGVVEFTEPEIADLPSSSEVFDKGGRIVRYIASNDSTAWASQWVRGFTSTGTTASGPDIVSVTNPENWREGDLILLENGTTRYIHVVTAISGTTLTISPNAAFTQAGATLRYYGHVPYDTDDDRYGRPEEEVAAQFNLSEFTCGGPSSDHRGPAVYAPTDVRTGPLGVRLSDLSTTLEGSTGFSNTTSDGGSGLYPFDWLVWPNSGTLRLRFLGTGLALAIKGTTDLGIRIDGTATNMAVLQDVATRYNNRIGGTYIVGELPYGYHVVDIVDTSGAADQRVQGVTIFQPKKPTLPEDSFELLDSNIRGQTDTELGYDVLDGASEVNFGNINYDPGAIVSQTETDSINDSPALFDASVGCKDWNLSLAGAPSGAEYEFVFMGTEFTIVWANMSLIGANLAITVRDHDGIFRSPSAVTGFTVTGVDSVASTAALSERETWTFSQGGVHVISFTPASVGDTVDICGVEWDQRLHNYRTKKPYGFEHYMPFQHCGLDIRNMTPIPSKLLPVPDYCHVQGFSQGNTVNQEDQTPFFFYCPGGLMAISVDGAVLHNQPVVYKWRIEIDGGEFTDFDPIWSYLDSGAASDAGISSTRYIILPQGFHWAILRINTVISGEELWNIRWTAKYIPNGHANHLSNRGILPEVGTQGKSIERSY